MKIKKLEINYYEQYEKFVISQKGGLFYYSLAYMNFIKELLNCESYYLIALDETDYIIGVLPIMYSDGKYGQIYNSLPYFGSNGGILSTSSKATKLLLNAFDELIQKASTASCTIVSNPLQPMDIIPEHEIKDIRIGQFTSLEVLEDAETELMARFHSKTRNMVRKSLKSGMSIERHDKDFSFLKTVHIENMKKKCGAYKDDDFFNLIPKYFRAGQDYRIYVAFKDGIKVAALLLFYFNGVVEYFMPVIKDDYKSFQPLSLLIFNAMTIASNEGYKIWNWGGTWLSQDGVYKFKSRFGAKDIPYEYFITVINKDILKEKRGSLMNMYKGFYKFPFELLLESPETIIVN